MYDFCFIFIIFIIYSIIGYLVEVTSVSLKKDEIELNRGFLIGPYIPIFGFGSIAMIYLLIDYQKDLLELFVMGAILCTILEYMTSLIMEKIFHLRWWDYSDRKFNINGRVCLENSVYFGIGGVILVKVINPILVGILEIFPETLFVIIVLIIFVIFLVDVLLSFSIVNKIKQNINIAYK